MNFSFVTRAPRAAQRCGTCRFWPLSKYAEANKHEVPAFMEFGAGGPHCDGSVSDCRRRAPTTPQLGNDDRLFGRSMWPTTRREDWCGEWELRP